MGRVEGKVAFVTGAGRGQGRSHAVRLAEEGADIIAVDLCENLETVGYDLASVDDLQETARTIEKLDRRVVALQADVRDAGSLKRALEQGITELGKLDVVVAQAGIAPLGGRPPMQAWTDVINTNLVGTINAIQVSLPHLREGGSIIATGSAAALMNHAIVETPGADPGGSGYAYAKRALSEYVHELATNLAGLGIRANVVHPTNVNTPMLQSAPMYRTFRRDLENPTREDAELAFPHMQAMKIPYVEPIDISNAVLFLASDESRYVTGIQLRVDAGGYLKTHGFHA
jgi:SDR family mycofactocin-dependent oxidoreductase